LKISTARSTVSSLGWPRFSRLYIERCRAEATQRHPWVKMRYSDMEALFKLIGTIHTSFRSCAHLPI
ncbi:hypothetical protein J7K50_01250, partial [bacterium]|nr:hypothetical protein [bacterium]